VSIFSLGQFASKTGLHPHTLQRWDREGRLKAGRTATNRRYYTDEHLREVLQLQMPESSTKAVAYVRVSSQAQKPDLKNQRLMLEQFAIAQNISIDEWVEEIGGGLNFKRPKFLRLIDQITIGEVNTLVIAHKDRLARFGFELLEHLCQINKCRLVILDSTKHSPEQELVQDLMTIIHYFSSRLYGLRNYRKALKEALKDDSRTQDKTESN
jgi:putative resolvase